MKDLEKNFTERFRHRESPMSDAGTEDLWGEISAELDEDDGSATGIFGKRGIWIGGCLLLITFVSALWLLHQNDPIVSFRQHEVIRLPDGKPAKDAAKGEARSTSEQSAPATDPPSLAIAQPAGQLRASKPSKKLESPLESSLSPVTKAQSAPLINERDNVGARTNGGAVPDNILTAASSRQPEASRPAREPQPPGFNFTKDATRIPPDLLAGESATTLQATESTLSLLALKISPLPLNPVLFPDLEVQEIPFKEATEKRFGHQPPLRWELGIGSGANYTEADFVVDDNPEWQALRNVTEGAAAGARYAMQIAVRRNNWVLSSGLEYGSLWRKFRFETSQDSTIQLTDVLLSVVVDPSTGETTSRTFGDAEVAGSGLRRVQHFNNYRLLSVPLTFGYRKTGPRWSYGLSAGIELQFAKQRAGRGVDTDGRVINYQAEDPPTLLQNFSLGLRLSPELGYRLNDRLTLTLTPGLSRSRQGLGNAGAATVTRYWGSAGVRYQMR